MGSIRFSVVYAISIFIAMQLVLQIPEAAVAQGLRVAPESESRGQLKTATSEYHLPAAIDPDVLENQSTEIWARVFWPAQLVDTTAPSKKRPLLIFLHGNHGTCGVGASPRNDSSCQYTNEGTCPAGYQVTPNHEGYNYAAENLASWGYIVVSINANRGITCGSGNADDWGLVLARGRLVLRHLQLWNEWSSNGGAPASLGDPDLFKNLVDLTNVGLMGHSRGGEGVRAALNLYRDSASPWVAKIPGLDVRAIYEIGAVDGQSTRVLDAPSVAWNQLLPLCDGDVSDLEGRAPFERMTSLFSVKGEAETRPSPKSLLMVWGANHNYFNTEWQMSDSYSCAGSPAHKEIFDTTKIESIPQQNIARQSMTAFFRAHVGPDRTPALAQNFDPSFAFPSVFSQIGMVDRDFFSGYEIAKSFRVDDFTAATGFNPAGTKNTSSNVQVDHRTNSEPPVANVTWTNASETAYFQTNFQDFGKSADVSSFDFLDLRVGHVMADIAIELASPIDFSVSLVAGDDARSPLVSVGDYSRVLGPPNDSADLTQTIRIPLASFGNIDLTKIRGVRFVFNKTAPGAARLAHVRFGVETEKMTPFRAETFSQLALLRQPGAPMMDDQPAATTPSDLILPDEPRVTPHTLLSPLHGSNSSQRRASWLKPRKISKSSQLHGAAGFEILVTSLDGFPISDALAVLNVENHLIPISRFPSNGDTHTLIFTLSRASYALLPDVGRAQIQFGLKAPSRVWKLPDFTKATLNPDLGM